MFFHQCGVNFTNFVNFSILELTLLVILSSRTYSMIKLSLSKEASAQCGSNESRLILPGHSVQVLSSDAKGNVCQNSTISASIPVIFIATKIFEAIEFFPSTNTDRKIAFWYFLESFAQCASNESNPIALWHSVQVLPSDEKGHVRRNGTILSSIS